MKNFLFRIFLIFSFFFPFSFENKKSFAEVQNFKNSKEIRLGFVYTKDSIDSIDKSLKASQNFLNAISPTYYTVQKNGVVENGEISEITEKIRSYGFKIYPRFKNSEQFANFDEFFWNSEYQKNAISNIKNFTEGFDGVNLDFEGLKKDQKDNFSNFVCNLKRELGDKILQVDVISKNESVGNSWSGIYDYKKLGECSDFVLIMAYDMITPNNKIPQPSAPIWWVDSVVNYAKSEISSEKIILGTPFYGIRWNLKTLKGRVVNFSDVMNDLANSKSKWETFDKNSGTQFAQYTLNSGEQFATWYENNATAKARFEIFTKHNLGGIGFWRLTQEDFATWNGFFDYEFISQTKTFISMKPNETKEVFVELKNRGSNIWKKGEFKLGTTNNRDRISLFLSKNRVEIPKDILPNETIKIPILLKAPNYEGSFKEYFSPVVENRFWLKDIGIHFVIFVSTDGNSSCCSISENSEKIFISSEKNKLFELKIKNTTDEVWKKEDFFLSNPADENEKLQMVENEVLPNEFATFLMKTSKM